MDGVALEGAGVESAPKKEVKVEVSVREAQITFPELIKMFVKSDFCPAKMDEHFNKGRSKPFNSRGRLRNEFNGKLPDEFEEREKDGETILVKIKDGGVNQKNLNRRKLLTDKVKATFGPEKAAKCEAAIVELFKDMRVGGSGRSIDKDSIIADLQFDLE